MRALCLFSLLVYVWAQMNTTNTSTECSPIIPPPDDVFRPRTYSESSRVAQLAAYTSEAFCVNIVADYASCSSYTQQLIGMIAAPIVLGVVASVSLWFYLCCRTGRCCACGLPLKKLWMVKALLGALLLCSFIAIYTSFSGSGDFKAGADNLGLAIANIQATVDNVNGQLRNGLAACDLVEDGSTGVAGGHCDTFLLPTVDADIRQRGTDILNELPNVRNPMNSVLEQMDFTADMEKVRKAIVENSSRNIDRAFYSIVGIYTLALLFGVAGLTCAPIMLNAQLCLGSINVIIAGVFIGIELGFSAGVSDFCHPNPRVQILGLLTASGTPPQALEGLQYMMSCEGFNPIKNRTDDIVRGMTALQQKVCVFAGQNSSRPECNADLHLADVGLKQLVNSSNLFFNTIGSCRFFNEPLVLLTDDAVCTNMVDGLYAMWTAQMVATLFLIAALFVTPCVKARIRQEDEDPVVGAKKRSSTVAERRDSEMESAHRAPTPYVPEVVYVPPPAAEAKYDDAPPSYSPVEPPNGDGSEPVEMDNLRRDKIGDPIQERNSIGG